MDIYKTVLNTMNNNKMTEPGMHVIAAVSGGADSLCLLFVLKELSGQLKISLEAFHLHHGLRGEDADRDAAFVEEICKKWKIPVTVKREQVREYGRDHGLSLEEAGRILRYQALEEMRIQAEERFGVRTVIAVAHHRGDSEETILHNLFRGSGLKGLRGIQPVRDRIIRPFLDLDRAEITGFLTAQGMEWQEDLTNQDNEYTRNKIRNQLLPFVRENINREVDTHILQAGKLIAMADDFLEETAEMLWKKWGENRGENQGEMGCAFPADVMKEQKPVIRYYLIRRMVEQTAGTGKDLSFSHIEAVERLLWGQTGKQADLPGKIRGKREYDWLCVEKKRTLEEKPDVITDVSMEKDIGKQVKFEIFSYKKGVKIPKNQYTKWFDYDKMKSTLCLRFREPGDYISLSGGGKKSVKSFMIDEKIPRDMRGQVPLLADGKHIVWIIGYRISEYYKITEDTGTVLEVRFGEEGEHGR